MTNAMTTTDTQTNIMEQVLMAGDLSKLTPEQRTIYYMRTCESLKLNPMTRPFEYITLNGKLTLYARKDCTDQLRNVRGVSIGKPDIQFQGDLIIVAIEARDATGRTDSDIGVVNKTDMRGDLSNVLMKAVTKAKRRVTLSICGLGMLDETEVETIADAKPFSEPAPVVVKPVTLKPAPAAPVETFDDVERAAASGVLSWLDANPEKTMNPEHADMLRKCAAEVGADLSSVKGMLAAWRLIHARALHILSSESQAEPVKELEY